MLDHDIKGYDVIQCESCGFAHLDPVPTEEDLAEYYKTGFYETHSPSDWAEKEEREQEYWDIEYKDRLETFSQLLGKPTGRLLDIGCGSGWFLAYAMRFGWDALGVEPSDKMIRIAESLKVPVIQGVFPGIDLSDHSPFDAVHLKLVLEHVHNPVDVLKDLRHILSPDGLLCIEVPNDFNPLQGIAKTTLDKPSWWVAPPVHINYFTFESLQGLLERTGYVVEEKEATFPMEWFLLQGIDYIGNDPVGRECHGQRMKLEMALEQGGLRDVRRDFGRWLASRNIGREIVIYARKDRDGNLTG